MRCKSVTVSLLLLLPSLVLSYTLKECNTDDKCPYGLCSENRCVCRIDCSKYPSDINQTVCIRDGPSKGMSLCEALDEACTAKRSAGFRKPYNTIKGNTIAVSCDGVFDDDSKDYFFCEDQHRCSNNGICRKGVLPSDDYCECNSEFDGEKCQTRLLPSVSTTHPSTSTTTTLRSSNENHGNLLPLNLTSSSSLSVVVSMTCMICGCLIVFTTIRNRSRRNSAETTNSSNDDVTTSQQPLQEIATEGNNTDSSPQNHRSSKTYTSGSKNEENMQTLFNSKDELVINSSEETSPLTRYHECGTVIL